MEQQLNLLLIEDVAFDAELIHRELDKAGMQFATRRVETREDFLAALSEFHPDIILADYTLPQFSAVEALRLLKEMKADVPLILVTGSHSEEVAVECMKEGADDYILKASLRRLPSALQNLLKKKSAERDQAAAAGAFRRREEQYRLITENTRDLICLLGLKLNFIYASPSCQRVLGYAPEDLLGRDWLEIIHEDDAPLLKNTLDEALFFREGRTAELRFRHTDGRWQIFESAISHIFDGQGRPERALVVARDTSDRKLAEKEIRKLAAFPRFNPNPVLEFSAEGALTYFNDAAMAMARSLRQNHPQAILPLTTATIVRMCLATGQEKLHQDSAMGGRTLSWSFFPILTNQVVHCYCQDVTERLNLEAQLRQAQRMDSIGQLAAGVAHDFNNILTIIQGHAGLILAAASLDPDLGESAKQISQAAERAANLTRQLLTFSRKQVMQPQLLDLNEVISDVSRMLRTLIGDQITLRRDTLADLPAIHADPGMLEQILVNFAVNARDAMPRGGTLVIRTYAFEVDEGYTLRHPEARPGYFVCLSVADTGHGMEAETLARIFEPFFTTKEIGQGTGLGLATVYGIVKQHQGWIEVESEVGKGTTFRVLFPVVSKAHKSRETRVPRIAPGGAETILIAEDETPLRDLVKEILETKGYTVLAAPSGPHAIKIWHDRKNDIDLLLTDMMMPGGMSGRELADQILADNPRLKVIYTSGHSVDLISPGFPFEEGLNFLQKPYHPETLAQTVRNRLDAN